MGAFARVDDCVRAEPDALAVLRSVAEWRDAPVASFARSVLGLNVAVVYGGNVTINQYAPQRVRAPREPVPDDDAWKAAARGDIAALAEMPAAALRATRGEDDAEVKDKPFRLGEQPIHCAAREGHLETVKWLVRHGVWPGVEMANGTTVAACATMNDSVHILQWLDKQRVNVNKPRSSDKTTAFHFAAMHDSLQCVQWFVANGYSMSKQDGNGSAVIHVACANGSMRVVRWMLDNGATLRDQCDIGQQPLHYAAGWGRAEMARFLLDRGAVVDAATSYGTQPIHCAAEGGNVDILEMFVRRGASVNARQNNGATPLTIACEDDCPDAALWLIQNGANINDRDENGKLPVEITKNEELLRVLRAM